VIVMPTLTFNSYGKSKVRLTKVVRSGPRHALFEINADIQLIGDFAASYTDADNRKVIATDTIKNTVYVVAKEQPFDSVEAFAVLLAKHFLATYPHVSGATVELTQSTWARIDDHDHSFVDAGSMKRLARATATPDAITLVGGVLDLAVLKTTASAWADFHSDRYRTLKDTHDRILATKVNAEWTYDTLAGDFESHYTAITRAMLHAFATQFSPSAQQTITHLGEAALAACANISSIHLELPNLHRIPFNLDPFGLKFENDIFVATDEPHGLIKGTISRK
jgi:urate oxidase